MGPPGDARELIDRLDPLRDLAGTGGGLSVSGERLSRLELRLDGKAGWCRILDAELPGRDGSGGVCSSAVSTLSLLEGKGGGMLYGSSSLYGGGMSLESVSTLDGWFWPRNPPCGGGGRGRLLL